MRQHACLRMQTHVGKQVKCLPKSTFKTSTVASVSGLAMSDKVDTTSVALCGWFAFYVLTTL